MKQLCAQELGQATMLLKAYSSMLSIHELKMPAPCVPSTGLAIAKSFWQA